MNGQLLVDLVDVVGFSLGLLGIGCLALSLRSRSRRCRCHDDPAGWVPGMAPEARRPVPPMATIPPWEWQPWQQWQPATLPPASVPPLGSAPVRGFGTVYQSGRAKPVAVHGQTLVMPRVPDEPKERR